MEERITYLREEFLEKTENFTRYSHPDKAIMAFSVIDAISEKKPWQEAYVRAIEEFCAESLIQVNPNDIFVGSSLMNDTISMPF